MTITKHQMAIHLLLQGNSNADVERMLKCGRSTVDRASAEIKAAGPEAEKLIDANPFVDRVDGTVRTLLVNGLQDAIKSEEDMLAFFKVDPKKWRVRKQRINSWGGPQNPSGQRRIELERIPGSGIFEEYMEEALAASPSAETFNIPKRPLVKPGRLAVPSIHDLHFGLLAWGKETGHNYDIDISERLYLNCVKYMAAWFKTMKVEKIMHLVGSDFFNVNSKLNTTVRGTPQDEDVRWKKTFVRGRKMAVKAIDIFRQVAPVEVIIAGGNHDEERAFMVGEALYAWYRNCHDVVVDNHPALFKFKHWGKNLLGFCHGDGPKIADLPLIMAQDAPSYLWAKTEYREWHTGHLHHDKRVMFEGVVDKMGIKIRRAPSLVAASEWEHVKGYRSAREALATIYDRETGPLLEIPFRPEMAEEV